MGVRPEAEHQEVERRHRAVVLGARGGLQPGRVAGRRRGGIVAVRAVGPGHGVHPGRIDIHMVEQCLAGAGLVTLRVAGRQEPLIPPPDVQFPPVHGVPCSGGGQLGQHSGAHPASGEHDRGRATGGLGVDQPGDQPGGHRLGEQALIPVDQHGGSAHEDFLRPCVAVLSPGGEAAGATACGATGAARTAAAAAWSLAKRATESW